MGRDRRRCAEELTSGRADDWGLAGQSLGSKSWFGRLARNQLKDIVLRRYAHLAMYVSPVVILTKTRRHD